MRESSEHFIIAAKLGDDDSLEGLKSCYREGAVSKEDFAAALRAHQAAVDATKSPQREAAELLYSQNSCPSKRLTQSTPQQIMAHGFSQETL